MATSNQDWESEETDGFDSGPVVVIPLTTCPHLSDIKPVPSESAVDARKPCAKCKDTRENWVCLGCYETFCSRYVKGHMLMHNEETQHPMVLSFSDITVWCYECQAYVHNPQLEHVKKLAYESKFGKPSATTTVTSEQK